VAALEDAFEQAVADEAQQADDFLEDFAVGFEDVLNAFCAVEEEDDVQELLGGWAWVLEFEAVLFHF
jgi:hypothetical protein